MSDQNRRPRGMGRIYQRGGIWWIAYSHRGKKYRESSGSAKPTDASKLLKKRLGEIGRGRLIGPKEERITFEMLAEDYLRDRRLKSGEKGRKQSDQRVAHLRRFFGLDRAVDITTERIRAFQDERLKEKATPATVNRDCAALSRMFNLAIEAGSLSTHPHIPKLEESRPRQGFFEHGDLLAVRAHLTPEHRDVLDFMYLTGWRVSAVLALEWRDLEPGSDAIRLRPELSKNREAQVLGLAGPLLHLIRRRKAAQVLTTPHIFHFRGKRIRCWRKRWRTACIKAGLSGMLRHDLRRTAARNLTRAGVPEKVAMAVTGHKSRSVFDRYNIVSGDDTRQAMERQGDYLERQSTEPNVRAINSEPGATKAAR